MKYIVLELFPTPWIVCDEEGKIPLYDLKTAQQQANECQQGMVVPMNPRLMDEITEVLYQPTEYFVKKLFGKYVNSDN